jgi:DtxR family Mn-dependent transcriptional regulator
MTPANQLPDPLAALAVGIAIAGLAAWVVWPRSGVMARWRRRRRMTDRVRSEDVLKHVYLCETEGRPATHQSIAGALQTSPNEIAEILPAMQEAGLLGLEGDVPRLTARGRSSALHIIRAHRLWQRQLADETGVAEAEWHEQAERQEHRLTPVDADALSAQLGNPVYDPHGDPIPSPTGEMASHGGRPLTSMHEDASLRIVHLEDEPAVLYAQLVASGLHPGMEARLLENSARRVRLWAGGDEHVLAPIVAANVSVVPLPKEVPVQEEAGLRLSQLEPGESGEVVALSPACRGVERRRMMDLGILPGTAITAELRSPGSDPTAYRIRGALIALRSDQAGLIRVRRTEAKAAL